MKYFIGTSGWTYDWNRGKDFQWYLDNSKLNAVELNASFYRFPIPNVVNNWAEKSENSEIRWSIKVNRTITHSYKLGDRAEATWNRLVKLFKPLDPHIDFYLFQLPPVVSFESIDRIERFFKKTNLESRFALEARHTSFFENIERIKNIGLTFVSIDSPHFPTDIYKCSNNVYLRMHGRKLWYRYNYTKEELEDVGKRLKDVDPEKAFVFFNNNHDMLTNSRTLKKILEEP